MARLGYYLDILLSKIFASCYADFVVRANHVMDKELSSVSSSVRGFEFSMAFEL